MYGYNADVYAFSSGHSASSDFIYQHAQTLVSNLALERKSEGAQENPIIWVAHSLGGILVKRVSSYYFLLPLSTGCTVIILRPGDGIFWLSRTLEKP